MPAVDLADIAGVATPFGFGVGSGPTPGTSYGIDLADIATPAPPFSFTVGDVTPPVDLPPTFAHAVRDRLAGDTKLMAALVGGLWYREAPSRRPGTGWPFGVYLIPADRYTDVSTRGDFLREGTLQISIFGPDQTIARRIADRAAKLLTDADARGQLPFMGGRVIYLRPSNPASFSRSERGAGGTVIWQEIRQLSFIYQGNYNIGV